MNYNKIRYYQLHKQNLIEQAETGNYQKLLKEHIGLHSTDFLTPFISLWARVKDFEPKALFDDLNNPFNALRIRAFRGTIFVVHRENLKNILAASKIFQASTVKNFEKFLSKMGANTAIIEQAVVDSLRNKNELTIHDLKKKLAGHLTGEYFSYALRYLEFKSVLVRTNHRYITDKVIRYGLMKEWIPEAAANDVSPEQALTTLILNYIEKFGPICLDDLAWWLPITKTMARKILDSLEPLLVSFDFNDQRYFMELEDHLKFENFRLDAKSAPVISLLPYEDHFPKAFLIRSWFLSNEVTSLVYKEGVIMRGQIFPSIWLNGQIIGGWEMNWTDKAKSAMKVEITKIHNDQNLSKEIRQMIENKREELESFVNQKLLPLMNK
jgi:hypothetical protein